MAAEVGVVRDERFLDHKPGHTHPEHPSRLKAVYKMVDDEFGDRLRLIPPELAGLEYLELVHTAAYVQKVLKTAEHGYSSLAPDTPTSARSYLTAALAAGGCIQGLEALIMGECASCFALVRPPGHHALPDRAGGFCIFNNGAIAARYALKERGLNRILIIDWDIHHGNGVQEVFYRDNRVLYFSTHDNLLYPYTGTWEEVGEGAGKGYTVNVCIPRDLEDGEFLYLYQAILARIIPRYEPELILVNAGFDGHREDQIGRSQLTERVFGWLTVLIRKLSREVNRPPLLLLLEGGYAFRALASCIHGVLEALTDDDLETALPARESDRITELVAKAHGVHSTLGVWADETPSVDAHEGAKTVP